MHPSQPSWRAAGFGTRVGDRGSSDRRRGALFEAVPNFSEGRDSGTIRALAESAGELLLDAHADASHHRTVLTLAGEAGALREAALRLFETARRRIDLRRHRGEHPRIGALDVLPFVPLEGASMAEAARLARSAGEAIAESGGVPVFFYGRAGPGRRPLPEIRRGGRRGLAARLARGEIVPDCGPRRLHPAAGAVAVGAREALIAFNLNLATDDPAAARRIAERIRTSGRGAGRLPALRAIPVRWRDPTSGRVVAQVSMNLLDFRQTSLRAAAERVRFEAAAAGTSVVSGEIVGLLPRAAAWKGMETDLGLREPARTIEGVYADDAAETPP